MVRSWMKIAGIPVKLANRRGFVAHGHFINEEWRFKRNCPQPDIIKSPETLLDENGLVHRFEIMADSSLVMGTARLLLHLANDQRVFNPWTAFVIGRSRAKKQPRQAYGLRVGQMSFVGAGGYDFWHVMFAFSNEDEAVLAKLIVS